MFSPSNRLRLFLAALVAVSCLLLYPGMALAADDDVTAVYLDEPAAVPAATVVTSAKVNEKYGDGKVRIEREVLKMSDDLLVNHGKYTEFYANGEKFAEGVYVNGVHDGPWSFWYDNGTLAKTVTFKMGQADGAWEVHRPDGSLQSKKVYKNNLRQGVWTTYFEDGKTPMIEQTYVDGRLDGSRKTFYPTGKPRQDTNFKAGVLDGPMIEWDENGRKLAEATFVEGKLDGKLVRWGADGSKSEQSFRDNKLVSEGAKKSDVVVDGAKKDADLRLLNSPK